MLVRLADAGRCRTRHGAFAPRRVWIVIAPSGEFDPLQRRSCSFYYMISRLLRCLTAPRVGYGLAFAAPSVAETLEQMIAPLSTPSASGPVAVVHGVASHIWCAVAFQPRSGSVDSIVTDTRVDSRSSSAV